MAGVNIFLVIAVFSCIFLSFTLVGVWVAFEYLPAALSSTNELAEINGPKVSHFHSDKFIGGSLFHHSSHKKPLAPRQLSIAVKNVKNPYVKPVQEEFQAPTAMAAKFR